MSKYKDISDEAQSLLVKIANNKNDAAVLPIYHASELVERIGLQEIKPMAGEMDK